MISLKIYHACPQQDTQEHTCLIRIYSGIAVSELSCSNSVVFQSEKMVAVFADKMASDILCHSHWLLVLQSIPELAEGDSYCSIFSYCEC